MAPLLYKSLQKARSLFDNGERCGNLIRDAVREILSQESLFEIDYVSLTDDQSLIEIEGLIEKYNIDLSLGFNDLYIGLNKESGLWLETHL